MTGTVTNAEGQPIEGAVLDFARVDGLPMNEMGLASLEDGTFERDLAPTSYKLVVRAEGYVDYTDEVQVDAGVRLELDIVLTSE
ncbi:MAG TPA: carboxypeptidase-like regulatory domain-containing protein [Candidatus Limnocylindria bacterium]